MNESSWMVIMTRTIVNPKTKKAIKSRHTFKIEAETRKEAEQAARETLPGWELFVTAKDL